nr:Ycf2 [Lomagramma matthewii]WCI21347.1 Ycf2 [Lomagramma matthewii]
MRESLRVDIGEAGTSVYTVKLIFDETN